jgi:hypothetical protein
MVFVPEEPAATAILLELDKVKLKLGGAEAFENQTAISALGCRLLLKAFALISALEVSVKGPVYLRDDSVAAWPSLV